ncbi:MAG: nucleotidyltransferase domain-containing protein [Gammaproteobacteria bacterium]
MDAIARRLAQDPRIAFALIFGSVARGEAREASDLDLAFGLDPGAALPIAALGMLAADLEQEAGRPVDLVLLDEAPPALAYRVFAEGKLIYERDHDVLVARKARAILDYLDFAPTEALCAQGVLEAAARG